jgi:hypothetical protein
MSWATERAEQIKQHEYSRASNREWQLHSDKMIRAKAPALWASLASAIERDVSEFNKALPDNPQHQIEFQTAVPSGLIARKPCFPALRLTAWLKTEEHTIRFTIAKTLDHDSSARQTTGILRIRLFDDGQLYLLNGERLLTIEEASQLLLDSLLRP